MKTLNPAKLLEVRRGREIETLHSGWICVLDKNKKVIFKKGNINDYVFLRSVAKPVQALSVIDFNVPASKKELAIMCGSHSASKEHLKVLNSCLKKNLLIESDLKCGVHRPFDEKENTRLIKKGRVPCTLHNNCSGKHIGMLAVCRKNRWDIKNYLNLNHPVQKAILKTIKKLSETNKIITAIDGCSAPTFAIPVINIAKMFSNLTRTKNNKYAEIINCFKKYPYLIGGKGSLDSEIIKASKGKLLVKSGAEGIIVAAFDGNAVIIKIADGSQRARAIVAIELLKKLKWIKLIEKPDNLIKNMFKNHKGKTVCSAKILF